MDRKLIEEGTGTGNHRWKELCVSCRLASRDAEFPSGHPESLSLFFLATRLWHWIIYPSKQLQRIFALFILTLLTRSTRIHLFNINILTSLNCVSRVVYLLYRDAISHQMSPTESLMERIDRLRDIKERRFQDEKERFLKARVEHLKTLLERLNPVGKHLDTMEEVIQILRRDIRTIRKEIHDDNTAMKLQILNEGIEDTHNSAPDPFVKHEASHRKNYDCHPRTR
ncbi:hypothetical protein F5Y03DRAFT_396540 [Xylaria venustula]|nr:hypothetical protein F5Y03DRAFT_396540 [Xylaria venustula]